MKYKIGQMVQLSAAGHKRQHNGTFVRSGFGIVLKHSEWLPFPYSITWFNKGASREFQAKEYEIKKVKIPKSKQNKKNT